MQEALSYLKCPICSGAWQLGQCVEKYGEKIWKGSVRCQSCQTSRLVREGVLELDVQAVGHEDSTIKAFGKEWTHYQEHGEYFQSEANFNRFLPGLSLQKLPGKSVVEVGCGGGRWLKLIGQTGQAKVVLGLEPSEAAYVAAHRTRDLANVFVVRGSVYGMAFRPEMDVVFSVGVINFVKDMKLACEEIAKILKPGGEFSFWVYAYEGNELYLKIFPIIQALAQKLPDRPLRWLCQVLSGLTLLHARTLNRLLAAMGWYLPMGRYLEMYRKLSWRDAESVIYDQLIPNITRYLKHEEVLGIIPASLALKELYRPSGNSWSVLAVKRES
jgi:SAM-dependent methyltransferase